MEEIRRYLDENFAADITLSAMANRYHISPSYLSLLFTEQTGKNFIDYLTERRIKKAKELLKHTDMKIYEVANAVGYKDSFYFSNCFKKVAGLSPSEYRGEYRVTYFLKTHYKSVARLQKIYNNAIPSISFQRPVKTGFFYLSKN